METYYSEMFEYQTRNNYKITTKLIIYNVPSLLCSIAESKIIQIKRKLSERSL